MQIGRPQIVVGRDVAVIVAMRVVVTMIVRMAVMMVVVTQQPGADQIHGQADGGDQDRLRKVDRHRTGEPQKAFPADQQRDQRQHHGAGEAGEVAELAGTEGEARVARLLAGIEIGQRADQHRRRMRRHVPAVRYQRHRAVGGAGDDLDHHHRSRQRDHEPGAARIAVVIVAEIDVLVVRGEGMVGHGASSVAAIRRGHLR